MRHYFPSLDEFASQLTTGRYQRSRNSSSQPLHDLLRVPYFTLVTLSARTDLNPGAFGEGGVENFDDSVANDAIEFLIGIGK